MINVDRVIGENVRFHRLDLGITQQELSSFLSEFGISWNQSVICLIEAGLRKMKVTELFILSEVLDISVEKLLLAKDEQVRVTPGYNVNPTYWNAQWRQR